MNIRIAITLLLCALCFEPAQPQFLKKLGKELKKTVEQTIDSELDKLKKQDSSQPEKQNTDKRENTSSAPQKEEKTQEIETVKLTETTFNAIRITPDTKFLKIPEYGDVSDVYDGVFSVSASSRYAFFLKDGRMLFDYKWTAPMGSRDPRFDGGVCLMKSTEKKGTKYPLCILYRDGRVKELGLEYSNVQEFTDGIARVMKTDDTGRWWVYIDRTGKEIYPNLKEKTDFGSSHVGKLREGLRPHFSYKAGKWGYIDAKGNIVIQPQFVEAREFSEGIAAVQVEVDGSKKWGFVDRTGKFAIEPKFGGYGKISDCRNGYVTWRDWDNSIDYFIDKTGKTVKTYKAATPFLNGYALVKLESDGRLDNMKVVDTDFNVVGTSPIKYIDKNDFSPDGLTHGAGVYSISGGGGDPFVMLPNGRIIIRTWNPEINDGTYGNIGAFTDDLRAQVKIHYPQGPDKRLTYYDGFIDEKGQMTIIWSSEIIADITDPWPGFPTEPYIPEPPVPGPEPPEPGPEPPVPGPEPPIIIEKPIPYPIIVKWYETKPIGPTVIDEPTYTVTTVASPPEGGTVSGAGTYKYGDAANVSATANKDWKLTGITCNDPMVGIDGKGGSVTVDGKNLVFTATFIKKDTIDAVNSDLILAGSHRLGNPGDNVTIPTTVYLEMSKDKNIATAYGSNTSGFLTAIINPNENYPSPFTGATRKNAVSGQINAKFFFVPMRISGTMEDSATGKKYLVTDGGQLMIGGVNVDISDPFMSLYLNFIMSYNGNTFATVSEGRYRIEMLDIDTATGACTLGLMERFSPVYGWLPSNDKRLKTKQKTSGFPLFPQKDPDMPMPNFLFNGCRLSPSEKRTDVMWAPPADWFESRNLFEAACKNLGSFMSNMQTDYEKFWNNP